MVVVNFMLRPLYSRERAPVPTKQEVLWAPEENFLRLPCIEELTESQGTQVDEMERFGILKQDVHTVTTAFKWLTHLFTLVYFVMLTQLRIPNRMMSIDDTLRKGWQCWDRRHTFSCTINISHRQSWQRQIQCQKINNEYAWFVRESQPGTKQKESRPTRARAQHQILLYTVSNDNSSVSIACSATMYGCVYLQRSGVKKRSRTRL
jgi:hypothetical protein